MKWAALFLLLIIIVGSAYAKPKDPKPGKAHPIDVTPQIASIEQPVQSILKASAPPVPPAPGDSIVVKYIPKSDAGTSNGTKDSSTVDSNHTDAATHTTDKQVSYSRQTASYLVYASLDKDVVGVNDTVSVTLDAKNSGWGVKKAEAVFMAPDNHIRVVSLELVKGDSSYGTWAGEISDLVPGRYVLKQVNLYSRDKSPNIWPVEDRSFYVAGTVSGSDLSLVYALLTKSKARLGDNVTIRIDASDMKGIEEAHAFVTSNRDDQFSVNLHLAKGDSSYGTWEGTFRLNTADATFSIRQVTLSNSDSSRTYDIEGRSVYVYPVIKQLSSGPPTPGDWIDSQIKSPFFPTFLGFMVMILLATIGFTYKSPS